MTRDYLWLFMCNILNLDYDQMILVLLILCCNYGL
jgi:hypothetical protein